MTDTTDRRVPQKTQSSAPRMGRRGFFGASLGMAAAGLVGGTALPSFATETGDERTKARYQADSAHIKSYYQVNQLVWPEGLQHADKA